MTDEFIEEALSDYQKRVDKFLSLDFKTHDVSGIAKAVSDVRRAWLKEWILYATIDQHKELQALKARLEAAEEKLESLNVFRNR